MARKLDDNSGSDAPPPRPAQGRAKAARPSHGKSPGKAGAQHGEGKRAEAKAARVRREPPPPIGPRLKQYRLKENLTLNDLQNLTGISKSMLSQIERGAVNPTFARVWHLTKSLGIGVGELLGEARSGLEKMRIYEHLKVHSIPVISSADGLCSTRILSPIRHPLPVEWYEMILKPGGAIRANAHGTGAWEHSTVIQGRLIIEIGDSEVELGPGDTVRYSAEQPHGARNESEEVGRILLVVVSMKELGADSA